MGLAPIGVFWGDFFSSHFKRRDNSALFFAIFAVTIESGVDQNAIRTGSGLNQEAIRLRSKPLLRVVYAPLQVLSAGLDRFDGRRAVGGELIHVFVPHLFCGNPSSRISPWSTGRGPGRVIVSILISCQHQSLFLVAFWPQVLAPQRLKGPEIVCARWPRDAPSEVGSLPQTLTGKRVGKIRPLAAVLSVPHIALNNQCVRPRRSRSRHPVRHPDARPPVAEQPFCRASGHRISGANRKQPTSVGGDKKGRGSGVGSDGKSLS